MNYFCSECILVPDCQCKYTDVDRNIYCKEEYVEKLIVLGEMLGTIQSEMAILRNIIKLQDSRITKLQGRPRVIYKYYYKSIERLSPILIILDE